MNKTIVDIIESVYPKCKNLDFHSIQEVGEVFGVLGLLKFSRWWERVYDPEFCDDPNLLFTDYASSIFGLSKSDIKRLIRGQGIRVNNVVPKEDIKVSDLPWTKLEGDWELCVIKKGKNEFDFILR